MMNEEIRNKLIQAAIYAPSADNSQPFQFAWSGDNTLQLFLDPSLSGVATDSTFVLSDLAIGTVIESVVLEARHLHLATSVTLFPENEQNRYFVARLEFTSADDEVCVQDQVLAQQIPLRCTDRRFPYGGEVTDQMISDIQAVLNEQAYQLLGFNQPSEIDNIIPTIFKAEKVRFESEQLHQELFKTVAFTRQAVESGMNLDVLGIRPFETAGFKWMSNWKVMNVLNKLGASAQIAKKSVAGPIKQSPALLLLTTADTSREGIVTAGRQLQRVWLKCTEMKLSVQLYAAPGVLSLVKPELSTPLTETINRVEQEMQRLTEGNGTGIMFFRIGKLNGQPPRTQRRQRGSFRKT